MRDSGGHDRRKGRDPPTQRAARATADAAAAADLHPLGYRHTGRAIFRAAVKGAGLIIDG